MAIQMSKLGLLFAGVGAAVVLAAGPAFADTEAGLRYLKAGDHVNALKELKDAAQKDDTTAMLWVGRILEKGFTGQKRQPLEATYWWEKAAYLGDPEAMLELSHAYRNGFGVKLDWPQAYVWDKKAVELGNAQALRNMGDYYVLGQVVEKDPTEGARWYYRAALKGNLGAYMALSELLLDGNGVKADRPAALIFLVAASKPVDGQAADRNAAANARNLRNSLTPEEKARAEKLTLDAVLRALSELDPDAYKAARSAK